MASWTENDITANGIKIHYLRTGNGDKPVLVLSHGFSGSGWSWYETAQALEADFDLILPDMRGHGQSHRCAPGKLTDLTGDLAGLITGLGLQKPILGGHSLGANYAARAAVEHPSLISALVLVDPAWYPLPPGVPDEPRPPSDDDAPPGESSYDRWLIRMRNLPGDEAVNELRVQAHEKDKAALRRWANTVRSFDANFFTTQDITQIDFPEITTMIQCPTLLITGACHNIMDDNFAGYIKAMQSWLARFL